MKPSLSKFVASGVPLGMPEVPLRLAEFLANEYQPRCWDPGYETEHHHHEWRGRVAAFKWLLDIARAQHAGDLSEEDLAAITTAEDAQGEVPKAAP